MLKRILYRLALVFALAFPASGFAQEVDLVFTMGYATYDLKQIKAQRDEVRSQYPVDVAVVTNFRGYYTYGGTLRYLLAKTPLGISFRTGSTGGRSAYSDYSGSIHFDQRIRYRSIGAEAGTLFHTNEHFEVQGLLRYWYNFTDLDFETNVEIYNGSNEHEKLDLKSKSSSVNLCLMFVYKLEMLKFYLDAGYEFYKPSRIYLAGDKDFSLINASHEKVKFDGSGLRINGSIAIRLSKDEYGAQ